MTEKVGVFTAMLTIVGTIIGGGIVGIPFATLQTGVFLVLVVHALNFIWGIYSVHLLLEAKDISGLASFSELGFYCFGRASIFIINGLIVIAQCGMPIIYFMIVGDIGNSLLERIHKLDGTFWSSKQFSILAVAILLFYFAIKKEIQELKGAGFVLLLGVIIFIIAMVILLVKEGTENYSFSEVSKPKFTINMLANIPTLFISYGFQSAFFPVYQSLKVKSNANGIKTTIMAFTFCVTVYIIVSGVALLKFGSKLEGNILVNVGKLKGWIPIVVDCIFLIIVMMHIPIVLFVGKEAFLIMVDEAMRGSYSTKKRDVVDDAYNLRDSVLCKHKSLEGEGKAYLSMSPILFYGISVSIYCSIVTAACLLNDITLVFGIIGSIAGSYLIFIAPSQFFIISVRNEKADVSTLRLAIAWVYQIFGFIVMGGCLFATIYTAVN